MKNHVGTFQEDSFNQDEWYPNARYDLIIFAEKITNEYAATEKM